MEQIISNCNLLTRDLEGIAAVSVVIAGQKLSGYRLERSLNLFRHSGNHFKTCSHRMRLAHHSNSKHGREMRQWRKRMRGQQTELLGTLCRNWELKKGVTLMITYAA